MTWRIHVEPFTRPRFNMPLELGLFLGAKRFGDEVQKRKRCLVMDTERYRYQRFISDLAGQDIHAHGDDPAACIEAVASWLRDQSRSKTVPGGRAMARDFEHIEGRDDGDEAEDNAERQHGMLLLSVLA